MGRASQLTILAIAGIIPFAWAVSRISDTRIQLNIVTSALISILGFLGTVYLVPNVAAKTQARGICGKDLNKRGTPAGDIPIPESAGLATGCIFLLCVITFELLHYYDSTSLLFWLSSGLRSAPTVEVVADAWLVDYNAALATITFMLFLGFVDDVLDVRWRVKLILPLFASLPLLVAYSGGTGIIVPKPIQTLLGVSPYLELGIFYKVYMVMLTIFCTNSINIFAGVNGLEAGQTFVVACAILIHNALSLGTAAAANVRDGHLFSLYMTLPLASTTLGLLVFNWYPSKVFVGDTFTYFAGMTIAVAGILGHFSETLLLFLIPQIFNFLYSIPQLFGWVFCPRHRLPVFDSATGLLRPKEAPDWNLVNLALQLGGHCSENTLCIRLLVLQALSCVLGFGVRYLIEGIYK